MPTSRPFAYRSNLFTDYDGTTAFGHVVVLNDGESFDTVPLEWYNGPDENLGYVIAHSTGQRTVGSQSYISTGNVIAYWRSSSKTEQSFIELFDSVRDVTGCTTSVASGLDAKNWLESNGYWTSFGNIITSGLLINLDVENVNSYTGTGTIWSDLTNNNNDATLVNSPSYYSDDYSHKSLFFESSNTAYATINDIGDLNNWTVEAWFNLDTSLTGKVSSIITNKFNLTNALNFSIGTNNAPTNYNICVGFFKNGWYNTTGFAPTLGNWYQVVGTYDGTTLRQYVNGVASGGTLSVSQTSISGGEIRLMRRWDSSVTSTNLMNGLLSIIRVYDRALTASEISINFDSNRGRYFL